MELFFQCDLHRELEEAAARVFMVTSDFLLGYRSQPRLLHTDRSHIYKQQSQDSLMFETWRTVCVGQGVPCCNMSLSLCKQQEQSSPCLADEGGTAQAPPSANKHGARSYSRKKPHKSQLKSESPSRSAARQRRPLDGITAERRADGLKH